jgi:hypothetical protein
MLKEERCGQGGQSLNTGSVWSREPARDRLQCNRYGDNAMIIFGINRLGIFGGGI